ncbi:unnamed protein product [Closterium sp. NIES-65]|nr:unnamed protein product [Closterium sp. NIES-65]
MGGGPGDVPAVGNLSSPIPVASLSSPSPSRARPAFAIASEATEGGAATTPAAEKVARVEVPTEFDARGLTRMVLQEEGYQQWEWQGNKVNYVVAGDVSSDATPVLLIHGFGASVYHWSNNPYPRAPVPSLFTSSSPLPSSPPLPPHLPRTSPSVTSALSHQVQHPSLSTTHEAGWVAGPGTSSQRWQPQAGRSRPSIPVLLPHHSLAGLLITHTLLPPTRYNIPALAASGRPVYAIDLIGFGWSDRALIQYSAAMWADQVSSFIRDVIGRPAVLVGNSVGGYVTLTTAANHPDEVAGTVLVNAAGKFSEAPPGTAPLSGADESPSELKARKAAAAMPVEMHAHQHGKEEQVPFTVVVKEKVGELVEGVVAVVGKVARRVVLQVTFLQAKQPGRIKQVLELVYPNASSVDEELVRSIVLPTRDPNAAEVYYRLSTQVLLHPSALSLNDLLSTLRSSESPMLLLWGALDPWMTPAKAQTIVDNYPAAQRVDISAGHCPHDEDPDAFNRALLQWLQSKF